MNKIFNFLTFQVGWFGCVLGAAHGSPWLGPVLVSCIALLHLAVVPQPRLEIRLMALAALVGILADSLLVVVGLLQYESGLISRSLAPYWIVSMWILFATTLNVSLRWLHDRYWLAAVLGAIGGPASYLAGERLGAVMLVDRVGAVLALAMVWMLAMPTLIWAARRSDGTMTGEVCAPVTRWALK